MKVIPGSVPIKAPGGAGLNPDRIRAEGDPRPFCIPRAHARKGRSSGERGAKRLGAGVPAIDQGDLAKN
jgi:hypothetical protein